MLGTQGRGDTGELRTEAPHRLKVPQELQGTLISVCRILGSVLKYGPIEEGTQQPPWHSLSPPKEVLRAHMALGAHRWKQRGMEFTYLWIDYTQILDEDSGKGRTSR